MPDQIIDCQTACQVQADALRTWYVVGWIVVTNHPDHPGKVVARLLSGEPSPYVLVGETLPGLQAQLPPGLTRQPQRPEEAIEIWYVR